MDICSITKNLKTQDHFDFENRIILFSKITSYDDSINMTSKSRLYSDSWPEIFDIKFSFKIYCGGDEIEISSTATIFPKQHKIWKTKKLLGFIPFKYKTYESEFWDKCSLTPLTTQLLYLTLLETSSINIGYTEWFAINANIQNHYYYIIKMYKEFTEKFNEYKIYNS